MDRHSGGRRKYVRAAEARGRRRPAGSRARCGVRYRRPRAQLTTCDRLNRAAVRSTVVFRDLSRPVETGMPTYPGDPDVTLAPDATHETDGYATSELRTGTHAGTHVDAPRHTLPDGEPIDERAVGRV